MAKAQPKSTFLNQQNFSNKVHERVLKATQDIAETFDKFKIENDGDAKYFFHEVNHYYQDLTTNIFHLRKIIVTIGESNQSAHDLQDVLNNLNKLAGLTQEYLNLQADEVKTKLKGDMVEIGVQVEQLLKIIQYDDLHEYKQKVVDCQHDLVLCVEKLKLYNQFHNISIPDAERLIQECMDKLKNNLLIIKTRNYFSEEEFKHYIRHSVQIFQINLAHMQRSRNIHNFKGKFEELFKNTEIFTHKFIEDILEAIRYDNPVSKLSDIIETCQKDITSGCLLMMEGMQNMYSNNPDEKEVEMKKDFLAHLLVTALHGFISINQTITDAMINNNENVEAGK